MNVRGRYPPGYNENPWSMVRTQAGTQRGLLVEQDFVQILITKNYALLCQHMDETEHLKKIPSYINFDKCREEIASALNAFVNRRCKRGGVKANALKEWKRCIFTIVDKRIKFYIQNTNLLPCKSKSS